jgi:hypothetical protein
MDLYHEKQDTVTVIVPVLSGCFITLSSCALISNLISVLLAGEIRNQKQKKKKGKIKLKAGHVAKKLKQLLLMP